MTNWTMLSRMSEIWENLVEQVLPHIPPGGRTLFADLADTSEADEQAAIDAGLIRPGGIRYAATRP